jgi:hypothetical protein
MSNFRAELVPLIKRAVSGPEGNPDWGVILDIVRVLEELPARVGPFIESFTAQLAAARRPARVNLLMLIDVLFKNSKPAILKLLQSPGLVDALNDPAIEADPQFHNFLYSSIPSWLSTLSEASVANSKFTDALRPFLATNFVPDITPPVRRKLLGDLASADEVLLMLTECLVSAAQGEGNDQLLTEITNNVREITQRLIDLYPQVYDQELKAVVTATREFCAVGLKAEADFRGGRRFDRGALAAAMTKATGAVQRATGQERAPSQKRKAPKRMTRAEDDITDEEFFRELSDIKCGPPLAPAASAAVDTLIDR